MDRDDLKKLSKDELVELVLKLQRPSKTSLTSSKPPSADRKAKRSGSKPGGAKCGQSFAIAAQGHVIAGHETLDLCSATI
tara:strand:+ start:511 stop:750 length:240 start_codon:yes stop_codon:yes gene_type:complete